MLKFSILGYGHIGRVHKNAIQETVGAELVSIIDINFNEKDQNIPVYKTLEKFLNEDTETDVVVIATPNGLHKDHAISCLKAGKHVLIEKPIALTVEQAKEILEVAEKHTKRVFSSLQLRFSPAVFYVKNLINNKKLGQIYMVNVQCYWNRNRNYYMNREWHGSYEMDGGVLFTQFSHFIDVLNYWFDDLEMQQSHFYNFNHQNITEFPDSGKLDFKVDDAEGNMIFTTSTFESNYESSIIVIAEKGTIKIGDQYLNELKYCNVQEIEVPDTISTSIKNFHPKAIEEVVSAIEENRSSVLDGNHALKLVKFVEDAYKLSESGLAIR